MSRNNSAKQRPPDQPQCAKPPSVDPKQVLSWLSSPSTAEAAKADRVVTTIVVTPMPVKSMLGDIDARDIDARDIDARDIDARNPMPVTPETSTAAMQATDESTARELANTLIGVVRDGLAVPRDGWPSA